MNQLKTTFAVIVLAGVLYGVYVTLNAPAPSTSHAHQHGAIQPPAIDFGTTNSARDPDVVPAPYFQPAPGGPGDQARGNPSPDLAPAGHLDPRIPALPPVEIPREEAPLTDAPTFTPPGAEFAPANPAPSAPPPAITESAPTTPGNYQPKLEAYNLKQAWAAVDQHVKDGKLREALAALSPFAASPHLTPEDRRQVLTWLDALAGKVIYGPEHYLSPPFKVTNRGQTLYDVSSACKVPVQVLQNINSQTVSDPSVLLPGTELKVIPGPFRADVSLAAGEMTLYVGELYAGRFAFTVGDERPQPGAYRVLQKQKDRTYISRDGRQIAGGDPANPYGNCWIDLGKDVSLHGSGLSNGQGPALGCLSFSPQDAQDLYGILGLQSEVVIK